MMSSIAEVFLTHHLGEVNDTLRHNRSTVPKVGSMTRKQRSITPSAAERKGYGKRLADTLDKKGYTQAWLADELNCTEAQVSRMCKHGAGSLWAFAQACEVIGESMDFIVLNKYPMADETFQKQLKDMVSDAARKLAKGSTGQP